MPRASINAATFVQPMARMPKATTYRRISRADADATRGRTERSVIRYDGRRMCYAGYHDLLVAGDAAQARQHWTEAVKSQLVDLSNIGSPRRPSRPWHSLEDFLVNITRSTLFAVTIGLLAFGTAPARMRIPCSRTAERTGRAARGWPLRCFLEVLELGQSVSCAYEETVEARKFRSRQRAASSA